MNEDIVIPIAFFAMVVVLALGVPLVRSYIRRRERGDTLNPAMSDHLNARLERIEHTVEATAIEIERIAEAQRFLTKTLSERRAPSLLNEPGRE